MGKVMGATVGFQIGRFMEVRIQQRSMAELLQARSPALVEAVTAAATAAAPAPVPVPAPMSVPLSTENGTISGEFSHIPSVYKERTKGVEVAGVTAGVTANTLSQSYAKLKQAERDYLMKVQAMYPDAYSLSDAQYAQVLHCVIDSVWSGSDTSTAAALEFVPVSKRSAVLGRPNQLRRTRKALQANAEHPALQALVQVHGKRGLGGLADTSLSKCIGNVRRMLGTVRALHEQSLELKRMQQQLQQHELRITELEARLVQPGTRSIVPPKERNGTHSKAEKVARVLKMVQQGRSYSEIAKLEGIGKGTISRWVCSSK